MSSDDSSPSSHAPYTRYGTPRRESRRASSRRLVIVLVAVTALVAVLVVLAGADYALSRGKIHRGVSVYGVELGGLTQTEAAAKLAAAAPDDARLVLTTGDKSWTIATSAVGARLDAKAVARAAYGYTRKSGLVVDTWRRLSLWFSANDLEPAVVFDREKLRLELDEIAAAVEVKPVAATVKIKKGRPVVAASREGLALDRGAIERQLATAFVRDSTVTGELPVSTAAPAVSTADAQVAADQAAVFLSGPLTLTYKSRSWVIPAGKLAGYLAFVPGDSPRLRATFASPPMEGYFRFISAQIGKPAKDASFKVVGTRIKVVHGKPGVGVAEKPTVRNIETAAQRSGSARTASLVIGKIKPELSYMEAKALKITRQISSYTTSVSGSSGRLHNVGLGASLLNDVLVAPGKVMSVNATTGERTAAKGYQVAPVIINGQLEDSIGGGMCQVSTTLFNAVFEAGLQVVERTNHSLYISHYPLGRDATVSYGSYDLKFRNDTKHWILVKSTFTGYSLTFSLYSAPLHRRVTSTVSGWYGFRPFPTVEKKDPALAKGEKKVETPGVSGRSITCYRKVYDANGKLLWNDTFVSTYQVVAQVVLVGTKTKASPSPSGSGAASPKPSPTGTKSPKPSPSATH